MSVKTFAAIDVGSYEIGMKVFEISAKNGMKEIDHIRHRIELGTDTYNTGKIGYERMDELCETLGQFTEIMQTYKTTDYEAYGTSAIRETENTKIVLDQIRLRTGLKVDVLSNSEQRFLDYKSVASKGEKFNCIIEEGTAFLDIGGGSIQVSLFDNSRLLTTQNIRLGILRIREKLLDLQAKTTHYERLIEELIDNEMHTFHKLYLRDMNIQNVIVVDDYISYIMKKIGGNLKIDTITGEQYVKFVDMLKAKPSEQVAKELGISSENSSLLLPSAILIKHFVETTSAKQIWMPGVSLSDGIAFNFAERNKLIKSQHNFENDIISCAQNINKRYQGSKSRNAIQEEVALAIFDAIKKMHGLGARERLLLRIASLLQDCGKYMSLTWVGECSYSIIMSTEIIGISHAEREVVAYTVRNSYLDSVYYEDLTEGSNLNAEEYLMVAKLTAILRVAGGLARSQKRKFKNVKTVLKDKQLTIVVETDADMILEKGLFSRKTQFFEEVFGLRPVIKQKKTL